MNEGVSGWRLGPFIFLLADVELSADRFILAETSNMSRGKC